MTPDAHSDQVLLEHIRECITRIQEYTGGGRSAFYKALLVQDAVVRNLQVLSESTQRLSDSIKHTEPDTPWRAIRDFRNVLTHGYLQIDTEVVWSVVEKDLPALADAIDRMISVLPAFTDERNRNGNMP